MKGFLNISGYNYLKIMRKGILSVSCNLGNVWQITVVKKMIGKWLIWFI